MANILDRRKEFEECPVLRRSKPKQARHEGSALPRSFQYQERMEDDLAANTLVQRIDITARNPYIQQQRSDGNLSVIGSDGLELSSNACKHTQSLPVWAAMDERRVPFPACTTQ